MIGSVLLTHKHGNPNWGKAVPFPPALPTAFELRVRQLQLTVEEYTSSVELYNWCHQNKNRFYVPEWLLSEWHITVDPNISAVVSTTVADRHRHTLAHFLAS